MTTDRRARRIDAIASMGALEAFPSAELQRTARLAAHLARNGDDEPLAAVHLLDGTSQHRLSSSGGLPLQRVPVDTSMCVQVVEGDRAVYTEDASREPRFDGNPYTSGPDPVGLYYGTPLRLSDGTVVGTLCIVGKRAGVLTKDQRARLDDLAEQASANLELTGLTRDLAHLATHDPLTGVANRRELSRRLTAAFSDPDRRPHEPSALVVDLDRFKDVNDRLGHTVGDEVLAGTAARLVACVRDTDLVGRLGGDEFVVLVCDLADPRVLEQIARRVRAATSEPYVTSAGPVVCSATVGLALGEQGDLAYELLGRADAQMYAGKRGA